VEDVRTWTMSKDFDYVFPPYAKAVLEEKGLDEKVIGYQMRSGQMTPLIYQNFREILPKAKFVDASYVILDFSYVKSPKEVEYMKKAAKIAEEACKAGMDAIKEGVTERDLAFAISKKQFELGAAYRSGFCLASGPNTASLHHSPVNRKLRNGDLVTMEPWGNYLYYQAHILRTGVLGSPPQKARDLHRVAKEAIEAGMKAMKPGVPMEEIEKITMEVAAEYGYEKYRCHRAGYNMGLKFLGLSRMEMNAYSLRKGDKTELKTGMIFALEPNFADLENRIGILLGNDVLVTENGGKALYDMPLDLIEK
jgi:Xaa-Pro dipeptidase